MRKDTKNNKTPKEPSRSDLLNAVQELEKTQKRYEEQNRGAQDDIISMIHAGIDNLSHQIAELRKLPDERYEQLTTRIDEVNKLLNEGLSGVAIGLDEIAKKVRRLIKFVEQENDVDDS